MSNEYIKLSDVINEILGFPLCGEACSHGGRCSLDNDHIGPHQAFGSAGVLCEWSADDKWESWATDLKIDQTLEEDL